MIIVRFFCVMVIVYPHFMICLSIHSIQWYVTHLFRRLNLTNGQLYYFFYLDGTMEVRVSASGYI